MQPPFTTPSTIRPATLNDVDGLVRLELDCFDADRLTRRRFRYLLTRANGALLIDATRPPRGYVLVSFRAGSSIARLYSIAVAPRHRGRGIGRALLTAAETVSVEHDCDTMRLELRVDNTAAERLYRKLGYRPLGVRPDYYEDHADALRMQKRLAHRPSPRA